VAELAVFLCEIEGKKTDRRKHKSQCEAPAARQTLENIHQGCRMLLIGQL
jgi:hypothetical protein